MVGWLIGIGIAGFLVSLGLSVSMRPKGLQARPRGAGRVRWWAALVGIAALGAGLALLFAWPAWWLGHFLGPYFDVSETTGGATFACIFGLGGAALSGAASVAFHESHDDPGPSGD